MDRINTLIAVAPNPGIFTEVRKWIEKLDVGREGHRRRRRQCTSTACKYGRAETMAMAIMALYSGNPMALMQMAR